MDSLLLPRIDKTMIFLSSTPVNFALRAEQIGFGISRWGSMDTTGQDSGTPLHRALHQSQWVVDISLIQSPRIHYLTRYDNHFQSTSMILPRLAQPCDVSPDGFKVQVQGLEGTGRDVIGPTELTTIAFPSLYIHPRLLQLLVLLTSFQLAFSSTFITRRTDTH